MLSDCLFTSICCIFFVCCSVFVCSVVLCVFRFVSRLLCVALFVCAGFCFFPVQFDVLGCVFVFVCPTSGLKSFCLVYWFVCVRLLGLFAAGVRVCCVCLLLGVVLFTSI